MILRTSPFALCAWAAFFVLWTWIGRVDWSQQKIRHRALGVGALLTAIAYAGEWGAWLSGAAWAIGSPTALLDAGALNVLLCASAALLLWWLRIWPAGDSKLFILLGALTPVMTMPGTLPQWRLTLATLINIFVTASLYLFIRSGWYVFQTRFVHQRRFLVQLGWRRELIYYGQALTRAARGWPRVAEGLARLPKDPRRAFASTLRWLIDLAWMTVVSTFFARFISSPAMQAAVSFLAFFVWARASLFLGRRLGETARWAVAGAILWAYPTGWAQSLALFGRMSIFSLFVQLGMSLTFRSVLGWLVLLLPFSLPLSGMLLGRLSGLLVNTASPALLWLARVAPVVNLALLGLFFGATWLMSKLADEQLKFVKAPAEVVPGLMPRRDFLDQVQRLDRKFHARVLSDLYADGLTREQAQSLARWCRRRSIRIVPVTPTMAFASWIFLGYFLSFCLGGRHIVELVL